MIKIFRRITTKKVVNDKGEIEKMLPSIKLVFPENVKKEEDWEGVASDESYDSEYEYNFQENDGKRKRIKRLKREPEQEVPAEEALVYDEVVGSDWEIPDEDEQIEIAELEDIVPFGKVAQNYITSLNDDKNPEGFIEISRPKTADKNEEEKAKNEEEEDLPPVRMLSSSKNEQNFYEVPTWTKRLQEVINHSSQSNDPLSLLMGVITKKVQEHITIISPDTKHKIQNQIKKNLSVKITNAVVKLSESSVSAKKIGNRKSIHDFTLTAIHEPDSVKNGYNSNDDLSGFSLQSESPPKSSTISDLRRSLLEQKYLPMMKRFERKSTMLAKKGRLQSGEVSVLKNESIDEVADEASFIQPFKHLESLYSAELLPKTDPNSGLRDIVELVNCDILRILILGKPRSGKTTLSKDLAASLDLKHIEVATIIESIIKKGQVEDEEEYDEDNPRPEVYNEFEKSVLEILSMGNALTDEQIIFIASEAVQSDEAQSKGFVVDLPLTQNLVDFILSLKFNFVVDLSVSNSDLMRQIAGITWDPNTNSVYSKSVLEELKKPKILYDADGEPIEDENPKPKFEDFAVRSDDLPMNIEKFVEIYNKNIRPKFNPLFRSLPISAKFDFDAAGLSPEKRKQTVLSKLGARTNKLQAAKILDPESDFKALLFQGIEDGKEPRSWSI